MTRGRYYASSKLKNFKVRLNAVAVLVSCFALLYAFPWLRIPDIVGVALPLQRLLGWLGYLVLFVVVCLRGKLVGSRSVFAYLALWLLFFTAALLTTFVNAGLGASFDALRSVTEFSKYFAVAVTAYLFYYALKRGDVPLARVVDFVVLSGAAAILLGYVFLALYWSGFQTQNKLFEVLAPTFGSFWGVWPTGNFLPRLAGTSAEPQQFSVVFLTPLLLMLSRPYVKRFWFIVLLGILALILSQSKFAIFSLAAVVVFVDMVYKKHRLALVALALLLFPVTIGVLSTLPTFKTVLEQGLEARAFTERAENTGLIARIIQDRPLTGIGVGQYGTYRSNLLYSEDDPLYTPNYKPNSDLLNIFAETGFFGFVFIVVLLLFSFGKFVALVPRLSRAQKERYLPFLVGAVTIFVNMFIGYEFLHAFFWINFGVLFYLHDNFSRRSV
ncbi:O-antigen ligase family protein [soil metagenome]